MGTKVSQQRKLTLEKIPPLLWGLEPATFDLESGCLVTVVLLMFSNVLKQTALIRYCQ